MSEDEPIQPGDEIVVLPVDGVLHDVKRGQNLTLIADLYDIDQHEIALQNDIQGDFLIVGQELIIPGGKPVVGTPTIAATVQTPPSEYQEDPPAETPPTEPATPPPAEVAKRPTDLPKPPSVDRKPPAASFTPTPTGGVLQKPCSAECFITQYFRAGHYALDMQERGGGAIYASEAGTVTRADHGWNGGYGNVIEVDHGNGLMTLYAHNKELYVDVGDTVKRGQLIAWMGNTGLVYGRTGIHVHFEVRLRGIKKNPLVYIQ